MQGIMEKRIRKAKEAMLRGRLRCGGGDVWAKHGENVVQMRASKGIHLLIGGLSSQR
jgi:hypothetical protein